MLKGNLTRKQIGKVIVMNRDRKVPHNVVSGDPKGRKLVGEAIIVVME